MDKTSINIARIIYDAYPHSDLLPIDPGWDCCDLAALLERVTTHDVGDGLFRFMVVEIVEGGESTLSGAIRVMERARQDIEAVLHALQAANLDLHSNQEEPPIIRHEEARQSCQVDNLCEENSPSYCAAAEYVAAEGRKIFTGHMNGGLWNARCLDACILSRKQNNKAAYEFLLKFGDQYAQSLTAEQKEVWLKIKEIADAMLNAKTP